MATRLLYRAVSFAEAADHHASGRLRVCANSCEGKHFATSVHDAQRWGAQLLGSHFAIMMIEVDEQDLTSWTRWPSLDGIGPAYFAEELQLDRCKVLKISDNMDQDL